ncbi:MAG: hypothetical protein AVO39_09365 [delta proteobacterium MLS_D]|jgi:acyl dehydratase|nr:MAG: hypothetical protein AVO39_09365 [delta proteobacterium MLS_D]
MFHGDLPAYHSELAKYFKTEKQHEFSTDFFADAEIYEVWDEIDFAEQDEVACENTFTIKPEDMKYYAEGCLDNNPFMVDEEFAERSSYGELVPHPIFVTALAFWCIGKKGRGNWIRTPGARNPGQEITVYENFRAGETIHAKIKPYDRYEKRGKYYLKYSLNFYNENDVLKTNWILTLILPRTRDDIRNFIRGVRGVND